MSRPLTLSVGLFAWVLAASSGLAQTESTDAGLSPSSKVTKSGELREQLVGWYAAERGRKAVVLPSGKQLVCVFDWNNGAPTSVGKLVVNAEGQVTFKQPKYSSAIETNGQAASLESFTLTDVGVEYTRLGGVDSVTGSYSNDKGQTMTVSVRKRGVHGSIDWRNNAPKTNGWFEAAPGGGTALAGHKWQEPLTLEFEEGAVASISVAGQTFSRVDE